MAGLGAEVKTGTGGERLHTQLPVWCGNCLVCCWLLRAMVASSILSFERLRMIMRPQMLLLVSTVAA